MTKVKLKAGSRPPLAAAVWFWLTFLGGANDFACNRFPPSSVLPVGVLACFLGYGAIWLAVLCLSPKLELLKSYQFYHLCTYYTHVPCRDSCGSRSCSALIVMHGLARQMRNFPLSRGTVSGYSGISAALYLPYLTEEESSPTPTHSDPLLSPSSSASNLGSFFESEYASDVETLLAVGEGAVKKKRRSRRGEDFKLSSRLIFGFFGLFIFLELVLVLPLPITWLKSESHSA
ncbi:hypothetical protein GQ457_09G008230 [Hibiscus cannabinus]